jgi:amino acid permease
MPQKPKPDDHSGGAGLFFVATRSPSDVSPRAARQDNLWGTVFSMCSATLGAGALSLPYAFEQVGALGGVCLLLLTAAASHYSVVLLTSAIVHTGSRSYEDLSVHLFGKTLGVLVELNIVAFCYGTAISYTVALGDLLHPLTEDWLSRQAVMALFWGLLMLPLSLVERISALQCASFVGVASIFYLVLTVLVHSIGCIEHSAAMQDTLVEGLAAALGGGAGMEAWTWGAQSFNALAIMMFAFTCQVNVPALYAELDEPSPARMRIVASRTMAICLLCYILVGLAGYRDSPRSRNGNLLKNYCIRGEAGHLMLPAYLAIGVAVCIAYPFNVHPCRYTLDVMFFGQFGAKKSTLRHVAWTLGISGSGLLVALYVPGINIVFQLMGSTCSAFVCFILPAAFALRLRLPEASGLVGSLAACALIMGGAFVGVIATYTTFAGLAAGSSHKSVEPQHHLCDAPECVF